MSESNSIFIKGARVNNLKNIDVEIPGCPGVENHRWRSIPFMRRGSAGM